MAKSVERLRAIELRRTGMSVKEISKNIQIAASTVSGWLKDIELSPEQRKTLYARQIAAGHRGRMIGAEKNRQKKIQTIEAARAIGINAISALTQRELLLVGLGIYWGEGSKSGTLSFINSDPTMVLLIKKWFECSFQVSTNDFIARVFINEIHRGRELKVITFWSTVLSIPVDQFRKTTFIKSVQKKRYENHEDYHGLLSLRIRRSSNLKYTILGLIEGIKNSKLPILPA
jgi:hypothetical protein